MKRTELTGNKFTAYLFACVFALLVVSCDTGDYESFFDSLWFPLVFTIVYCGGKNIIVSYIKKKRKKEKEEQSHMDFTDYE